MQKKPFQYEHVLLLREKLQGRDLVLFSVAFDSVLRKSDLLTLRVSDVIDINGAPFDRVTKVMNKTGKRVTWALSPFTTQAIVDFVESEGLRPENYLFPGRKKGEHLSGIQYSRLVKRWAMLCKLDHKDFSTHSMRRSKLSIVYEKTKDIEVCRQLAGHQSVANTSLYLNVSANNALDVVDSLGL